MQARTIITCAVTGNLTDPAKCPSLPITPAQIAQACLDAADEGAASPTSMFVTRGRAGPRWSSTCIERWWTGSGRPIRV